MSGAQKAQNPLAGGLSAETKTDPAIVAPLPDTGKRLATLKAQLALKGFSVHEAAEGFIVCRWNLSRHCPDMHALHAFAAQVGAA